MRFICIARPEGARNQRFARYVFGRRLGQRAGEREQHRTTGKRNDCRPDAHDLAASIDHERVRGDQRLDFGESEQPFSIAHDQARGRCIERA